jgi:uncharacterized membrane protein
MAEETIQVLIGIGIAASLILIWIVAYVDLARRNDLSVVKKVAWALIMFFGAYFGIAVYFIFRPVPEVMGKGLRHTTPESSEIVNELEVLHEDHADGSISDADYLEQKRSMLGLG